MSTVVRLALRALAAALVTAPLHAGPPRQAEAESHDLTLRLDAERPLLAQVRFELRGSVEPPAGSKARPLELRHGTRLDFVDELLALDAPAAGDLDVRRTFLRWERDGAEGRAKPAPRDNSLTGARALVTRRTGTLELELIDRLGPLTDLQEALKQAESVSWLAAPASVRVGERIELELAGLVNLLLDEGFTIQGARAKVTLRAVDADGLAELEGPLAVLVQDEQGNRGTFEGPCLLELDTRADCVRALEWRGDARMRLGETASGGELRATFEARLTLQAGKPARDALARDPAYRSVPRAVDLVRFELPSHWYEVEDEEDSAEATTYRTSMHGEAGLVTLELQFFSLASEPFDAVVDAAITGIEKEVRLSGQRSAPSPFGKGRSVRFQRKDGETVHAFAIEFYPCGNDRLMRARLGGAPAAFDSEFRQWQASLRTFELAE